MADDGRVILKQLYFSQEIFSAFMHKKVFIAVFFLSRLSVNLSWVQAMKHTARDDVIFNNKGEKRKKYPKETAMKDIVKLLEIIQHQFLQVATKRKVSRLLLWHHRASASIGGEIVKC